MGTPTKQLTDTNAPTKPTTVRIHISHCSFFFINELYVVNKVVTKGTSQEMGDQLAVLGTSLWRKYIQKVQNMVRSIITEPNCKTQLSIQHSTETHKISKQHIPIS